jgi:hypothetical protein
MELHLSQNLGATEKSSMLLSLPIELRYLNMGFGGRARRQLSKPG